MMVKRTSWLVMVAGLAGSVVFGCSGQSAKNAATAHAVPVAVSVARIGDLTLTRAYNGSLSGVRQAEPTAKVPETVTAVRVAEGEHVTAGQVLIEFDRFGPAAQVRQAEAVYLEAQRNYEKYERLYQGKAVSESERDYAETQFKVAKANYEAARDQVQVKSPISGVVTDIHVKVGQQTYLGQTLAVIADIDTVRLVFDVPYFDARPIKKGAPVYLRSELDTTATAVGWVREIAESADPVTRTVSIEVYVANPRGMLHPGMYVTGEVLLERREGVLVVPREALVSRGGKDGVFVVADSTARFSPVVAGLTVDEQTEIVSGVAAGDQIVVLGQQSLESGMRVLLTAKN